MVANFRQILVAVRDIDARRRNTLLKVATLARASRASIELFHAINIPFAVDTARLHRLGPMAAESMAEISTQTRRRLERLARSKILQELDVRVHAEWDYPAHDAIVRRALLVHADLVVAETHTHRFGSRFFLANTDWELIRACPCPLLLLKSASSYERPAVLAAVDPFHTHDKPARLDARLLETGREVARLLGGQLHAFHAYVPLVTTIPAAMGQPVAVSLPPEVEEQHAKRVRLAFDRVVTHAGIPPARRHLRLGDVPTQLADVVKRTRARIVVMGAVSRSVLKRVFIGSTAERVLDALSCDVLVVKPRGFKSRVPRRSVKFPGLTVY